jgi:STAS-like domain of unknown function (DUF4325)
MALHQDIRDFILEGALPETGLAIAVAQRFSVTRQSAHAHLARLVREGILSAQGRTRDRRYWLPTKTLGEFVFPLDGSWPEDKAWRESVALVLAGLPENVMNVWHYGFTEMFNNALDHSGGKEAFVGIARRGYKTNIVIHDNGEGIFRKIRRELTLESEHASILELAKGKLTTDPKRHSGEGIFFTSRAFDYFAIASGALYYSHTDSRPEDYLTDTSPGEPGTDIWLQLDDRSGRILRSVFEKFAAEQGDFEFSKTVIALDLARHEGEELVSRSQARRLVTRFEKFREVVLDFERIKSIGQAFADEVFRVFSVAHPGTKLIPIRMNEEVTLMVGRAQSAAAAQLGDANQAQLPFADKKR